MLICPHCTNDDPRLLQTLDERGRQVLLCNVCGRDSDLSAVSGGWDRLHPKRSGKTPARPTAVSLNSHPVTKKAL